MSCFLVVCSFPQAAQVVISLAGGDVDRGGGVGFAGRGGGSGLCVGFLLQCAVKDFLTVYSFPQRAQVCTCPAASDVDGGGGVGSRDGSTSAGGGGGGGG